jgi:hypothetical protein
MADQGAEFFETSDQVAADDLHVIKIELDAQVGRADLADYVGGVLDMLEKIIGPVARIDRFDQYDDAGLGGRGGGTRQTVSAAGRCSGGTTPAMQWMARPPIATT